MDSKKVIQKLEKFTNEFFNTNRLDCYFDTKRWRYGPSWSDKRLMEEFRCSKGLINDMIKIQNILWRASEFGLQYDSNNLYHARFCLYATVHPIEETSTTYIIDDWQYGLDTSCYRNPLTDKQNEQVEDFWHQIRDMIASSDNPVDILNSKLVDHSWNQVGVFADGVYLVGSNCNGYLVQDSYPELQDTVAKMSNGELVWFDDVAFFENEDKLQYVREFAKGYYGNIKDDFL